MNVRVKICGIQDYDTAKAAVAAGADALGFVFAPSRRRIAPKTAREIVAALPPFVTTVGIFVNASLEVVEETAAFCGLGVVQLHGDETSAFCKHLRFRVIKAFKVAPGAKYETGTGYLTFSEEELKMVNAYDVHAVLFDTYVPGSAGGTGERFDWEFLAGARFRSPVILAGGLTPRNVAGAVASVRPYAVDVSTGVETDGRKDPAKIAEFIRKAKEVF
jgi:phosphoribosylanthranilate isomerase